MKLMCDKNESIFESQKASLNGFPQEKDCLMASSGKQIISENKGFTRCPDFRIFQF